MSKVKCQKCDDSILVATAERNNGLCEKCSRTPSAVSPRKKAAVGLVTGSILLMIGIGLGLFGHYGYKHLDHVKAHWTQATGQVTSVTERDVDDRFGKSVKDRGRRQQYTLRYSYEANGGTYDSEYTYESYPDQNNKGAMEKDRLFYNKHQKGSPVTVYFNPAKHQECLLEREVLYSPLAKHLAMGGMGIFVILALCRILIDVLSLAKKKRL